MKPYPPSGRAEGRQGAPSRALPALLAACVFATGAASLGLEVVWSRLLRLIFGSTTLAVTTILVAYMLGLGLGGLLGGRLAPRIRDGVRAYGLLEVGVGLYALFVPWILDRVRDGSEALLGGLGFWPAALVRFLVVLVVVLPPTLAMGATLPVLVASLERGPSHVARRVGLLYGANTLGAVAGVLGATFWALGRLGVRGTNTAAALADAAVGLAVVLLLARRAVAPAAGPATEGAPSGRSWNPLVVSYGVVGFTALTFEVAWTRTLTMIVGASVYSFATILAGFLAGIALGSLLTHRWSDRLGRPALAYGVGVAALGISALGVTLFLRALPTLFLGWFALVGIDAGNLVWLGLVCSFALMLAPTLLLGALFPLATRLAAAGRASSGRAVGDVYFSNTLGSAAGAFCAGFLLVPLLGLTRTMALAIALDLAVAAFAFWIAGRGSGPAVRPRYRAPLAGCVAAAALVLAFPPRWNTNELASGVYYRSSTQLDFGLPRLPMLGVDEDELLFYEEGINGTISVHRSSDGLEGGGLSLRINGKTDASLSDMSTQVLSGHLPFLFRPRGTPPGRALVIGHASGISTGSATLHEPEALDVCEIEPAVIEASRFFDDYNHRPTENPLVRFVLDDGRAHLSTVRAGYDVIVSEPSNPWITGCSNLFTQDFFAEAHEALAPGGRLLQWIQLYGMDADGLRSILAALEREFAHAYGFLFDGESTDLMVLATDARLTLDDLPRWELLPEAVREDLGRLRIFSTADLWSLVLLLPEDVHELAREAPVVNTDDSMYVELAAPWFLYDDTPDTLAACHEVADGILPLLREEAHGLSAELLGELACSYLAARGELELADEVHHELLDPGDEAFHALYEALRGMALEEVSPNEALALLNTAVAKAPGAYLPRYHRAWVANQFGRYDVALEDLDVALGARPWSLEARHLRMKSLAASERFRQALAEADALLESRLVETAPRLLAERAALHGGFGRYERAIADMRAYLALEPYAPEEWELLARWYELEGEPAGEREALENATRARENEVRSIHWAARWHERFGSRREAVMALRTVLRMDPGNELARADLQALGETP